MGSCTYRNGCTMLAELLKNLPECPPKLLELGIECNCPLKKGNYAVHKMLLDLPAIDSTLKALLSGTYWVEAKVRDTQSKHQHVCFEIDAVFG